jgi:hypothetical protein
VLCLANQESRRSYATGSCNPGVASRCDRPPRKRRDRAERRALPTGAEQLATSQHLARVSCGATRDRLRTREPCARVRRRRWPNSPPSPMSAAPRVALQGGQRTDGRAPGWAGREPRRCAATDEDGTASTRRHAWESGGHVATRTDSPSPRLDTGSERCEPMTSSGVGEREAVPDGRGVPCVRVA